MTNYNDGKWHGWNGGECPVHHDTVVQITYTTGMDETHIESDLVDWDDEVVAFRVIKEHKGPREFWSIRGAIYRRKEHAESVAEIHGHPITEIIHVREVLE